MVNTVKSIKTTSPAKKYSEAFKRKVVREYERGFLNKDQLKLNMGLAVNPVF